MSKSSQKSSMNYAKEAQELEKFIKKKINIEADEEFNQQLEQEIQRNLAKQEKLMIEDLKRERAQQRIIKQNEEKKKQTRMQLQFKMEKSEKKRSQEKSEKQDAMIKERKYRDTLFQQRLTLLKEKERRERERKLREYNQKLLKDDGGERYEAQPIDLQRQEHYQRMLMASEHEYQYKKKKAEERKAFTKVESQMHQRRFSMQNLKSRTTAYEKIQKQKLDEMGEHLQKIVAIRKKKEKLMKQKIKKSQSLQKYAFEQQRQRMRMLQMERNQKNKELFSKLIKETPLSSSKMQKTGRKSMAYISEDYLSQSNTVSQQNPELYSTIKPNYRKEIQTHIKEYLEKKKRKTLIH